MTAIFISCEIFFFVVLIFRVYLLSGYVEMASEAEISRIQNARGKGFSCSIRRFRYSTWDLFNVFKWRYEAFNFEKEE